MKIATLTKICLISLCSGFVYAHGPVPHTTNAVYKSGEDVSMRFHAQWNVDEGTRKKLDQTYGATRISYDRRGHPTPHGLGPVEAKRWERLYKLCMNDGGTYCDDAEGSCELGTCGPNNEHCRPYIGPNGQPQCGQVCADYAFTSILPCNDQS